MIPGVQSLVRKGLYVLKTSWWMPCPPLLQLRWLWDAPTVPLELQVKKGRGTWEQLRSMMDSVARGESSGRSKDTSTFS